MNLSKLFITRPVATTVVSAAIILFGWFAYRVLPVSELPDIDFATVTVNASLPGADPQTMAATVATPLEKQFSTIDGLDSMNSTNTQGNSNITLQFNLSRDINSAAADVQNAISQAVRSLPHDMPSPPVLKKANPAASPVLYLSLSATHYPLTKLDEFAETVLAQRLSMVEGVAQISVFGSKAYAVRIGLNPNALYARGMDVNDALNDIAAMSTHQAGGILYAKDHSYLLETDAQLMNADDYNHAIIAYQHGMPIVLSDIGHAKNSILNDQQGTFKNGKPAILLAVQRQPGANTVAVIDGIKALLPTLTLSMPRDAQLQIFYDRSNFIKAALHEVQLTLIIAIVLVAFVLLLFLGNMRASVIAILALPVSIMGTFAIMFLGGFSLDNLSMMGLVLAVGFIIDDAIVVIENIVRYLEKGYDRLEATLIATQEIGFTVLSMTLSLSAVFLPILFMGGLIGRLFNEFGVVVATAILFSGFVALTLTPMLCGRFLNPQHNHKIIFGWFETFFSKLTQQYEKSLRWTLEHKRWLLWSILGFAFLLFYLFSIIGKGFIPTEDAGAIFGGSQVPIGTPYSQFLKNQDAAIQVIQSDPNVESVISSVGQGDAGSANNSGKIFILLKPLNQRQLSADQIIQELHNKLKVVPGIQIVLQNPPAIRAGAAVSKSTYQYVLQSTSWEDLKKYSAVMEAKMANIPGLQSVNSDLQISDPQITFHILKNEAATLGISPVLITTTLSNAFGEKQINTIYTPTDEYEVIAGIDRKEQLNQNLLNRIYIHAPSGSMVPLTAVVKTDLEAVPVSINHYDQLPAVMISFNLVPGASLGAAVQAVQTIASQTLPKGMVGSFVGSAQTFQQSMKTLPILLLMTILVIYLVLAILYEHFWHPITILTALPLAVFGALFTLFIFHQQLNLFSFIGLVMLVGLVKKNGIIMIDFALEARRKENLSPLEAIIKACIVRFRPIMMTTVAAIFATLPIAMGMGAGGETRQAMGIAVVGGLLFSQMLTLFITPAFYLYMEKWTNRS